MKIKIVCAFYGNRAWFIKNLRYCGSSVKRHEKKMIVFFLYCKKPFLSHQDESFSPSNVPHDFCLFPFIILMAKTLAVPTAMKTPNDPPA
ncbi:hypothetical protein BpHYR1_032420 [Brachionus plicatilis]|uniref:Uncharacterized protein n=1 Tax=Brachionus plicatilis TaxID=10195 RepID=A0A3M7T293_BRAPC|nr:hypothetical protein BpHYR1_032420 [Brachionus plicatilis]